MLFWVYIFVFTGQLWSMSIAWKKTEWECFCLASSWVWGWSTTQPACCMHPSGIHLSSLEAEPKPIAIRVNWVHRSELGGILVQKTSLENFYFQYFSPCITEIHLPALQIQSFTPPIFNLHLLKTGWMVKRSPTASSQFSFTAFVPSFHGDPEHHNWG